jgi:hypothetical protein
MSKIQITSRWTGALLFEHDCDDNTIKATVQAAVKDGADLRGADLRGADLGDADLRGAKNAELAIAMTRICPAGDLIVYKSAYKCRDEVIITLKIPADAKRNNALGRKCRAEYAEVIDIETAVTGEKCDEAFSRYDHAFVYRVGETVRPALPYEEDFTKECAPGIHFYITREECLNG